MKSPKNLLRFRAPHHGCQPFQIGFFDSFYRLKGLQKSFNGLFSNAWYLVQFALNCTFAPSVSVVGDSKSVGFVSQKLNDLEAFGSFVKIQGNGIAGIIDFFQSFGNSNNGNFTSQSQEVKTFQSCGQLPFPSVYDDE